MKTRLFNAVLILATIVPLLVLAFANSGIASADSPKEDLGLSHRATILKLLPLPTLEVYCGLPLGSRSYYNLVRINVSVPILLSGMLSWKGIPQGDGTIESRASAFNNKTILPPGETLVSELASDPLVMVHLTAELSSDVSVTCPVPGIVAMLYVIDGAPFLQVMNATGKKLFTREGELVWVKTVDLSLVQNEFKLFLTQKGGREKVDEAFSFSLKNIYRIQEP